MRNVSGTRVPKTKVVNFLTEIKSKSSEKGREKGTRTFFTFYHRLGGWFPREAKDPASVR
ncbi:MAG: hypothetical protein DMG89_24970 [Acidobacteria bacterium]|nr:MAG: hypothetical protein DMG89_24970 [Acidobacteriota bacterium]